MLLVGEVHTQCVQGTHDLEEGQLGGRACRVGVTHAWSIETQNNGEDTKVLNVGSREDSRIFTYRQQKITHFHKVI